MNKVLLSVGILSSIYLSGCGGSDSRRDDPIFQPLPEVPLEQPSIRVVFNPANSDINIPNDLLMVPGGNFFDFTLNTEGGETLDPTNPEHALSSLDGWSLNHPMSIRLSFPSGMELDASSVNADSIKLFEATQALEGNSAECQAALATISAPGVPCELGQQLEYGVDYTATYIPGSGAITLFPLKVLKPSQGHMLVVTDSLKDTSGRPVKGSGTWELARQNIDTNQVGVDALVPVQQIVNFMVDLLEPVGVPRNELSYAAYFSTQSTSDVGNTVKAMSILPFATAFQQAIGTGADIPTAIQVASQLLPNISTVSQSSPQSAFDALAPFFFQPEQLAQLEAIGLNTCSGLIAAMSDPDSPVFDTASNTFSLVGSYCASSIVKGSVDLPYFLDPTDPLNGSWKAACTSGATLNALGQEIVAGLVQTGQVGANNDLCQVASQGQLLDLNLGAIGLADPRNLTKFSPIPARKGRQTDNTATLFNEAGTESINVSFTVPNEAVIAAMSAATDGAIPMVTKPVNGWPVVVFQHGITGRKEDALILSGALSLAGFATVAIDHPLHGERGMPLPNGEMANASSRVVTDYLNLGSLQTSRDNLRQSTADIMNLRLSLNAISDVTGLVDIDASQVHFIGQSLGSIAGTAAVALANESLGSELSSFDNMYAFKTAVLNVPAGGIISFLLESADFGPLVKGSLLLASSEEFRVFFSGYVQTNQLTPDVAIRPAYSAFEQVLTDEQLANINSSFAAFAFAAQTVLDAGDPVNYAATIGQSTPVLMQLIVGGGVNDDGSIALTDQVNAITTALPLAGGQPLADLIGLSKVSQTTDGSGVVRFITGEHRSLLVPTPSLATLREMQSQAVSFFVSQGQTIVVTDTSLVEN